MRKTGWRLNRSGSPGALKVNREEYSAFRRAHVHADYGAIDDVFIDADNGPRAADEFVSGFGHALPWVSTPTGERVLAGLRYAQVGGEIVLIYGGAGLGKTCAIKHYQASAAAVYRVDLSPATGGLTACLQEIANAVGLRIASRQVPYLHRSICARLRDSGALVIIDEAQDLNMQALDQVRCIHDQSKAGFALVGNEQVYARLAGSSRAAYLDRLYSRIGKRVHIAGATVGDADALIAAWGIDDAECRARLRVVASQSGALRVLGKVIKLAGAYAQSEGRPIVLDDIEDAWQGVGGRG